MTPGSIPVELHFKQNKGTFPNVSSKFGSRFMPKLQVDDLPEPLYRKLKQQAKRKHRSLSKEVAHALARGLNTTTKPREQRLRAIEQLLNYKNNISAYTLSDPEELIIKDRER